MKIKCILPKKVYEDMMNYFYHAKSLYLSLHGSTPYDKIEPFKNYDLIPLNDPDFVKIMKHVDYTEIDNLKKQDQYVKLQQRLNEAKDVVNSIEKQIEDLDVEIN